MKILERRDPKKKQKRWKIEPLPFLRTSYSAAEIPEEKICVSYSPHAITKNPISNSVFSHIFLTNEIVLMKQTITAKNK